VPAGLQLYTVQDELARDLETTLRKVAAIGFKEVELPGLLGKTPAELSRLLADAGLHCRSAHLVYLGKPEVDSSIAAAKELGLRFLVAPIPWKRDPSTVQPDPAGGPSAFIIGMVNSLTLDDWKWNAELLNKVGEQVRMSGLQLAYHNIISSSNRMTA
jgi:sugar phosphate isomerase/epimerase